MHKVPQPKDQARILKAYLAESGITLSHQRALEALAKVMGFKNWKTMSAHVSPNAEPVPAPNSDTPMAQTLQPRIPGPAAGQLFSVPITVPVTMTATFQVRAMDPESAIDEARVFARDEGTQCFTLDEGNLHQLADFYCPDPDSVELVEGGTATEPLPDLTKEDFDKSTALVANNMGTLGEFWIQSTDGLYELSATLASNDPDNSNDRLRAQCVLTIALENGPGGPLKGGCIGNPHQELRVLGG
jgi:hypothetical protein